MSTQSKPRVKLVGRDGNAFAIMAACHQAWRKAGKDETEWQAIVADMKSADYDHLLQVAMMYFDVR